MSSTFQQEDITLLFTVWVMEQHSPDTSLSAIMDRLNVTSLLPTPVIPWRHHHANMTREELRTLIKIHTRYRELSSTASEQESLNTAIIIVTGLLLLLFLYILVKFKPEQRIKRYGRKY